MWLEHLSVRLTHLRLGLSAVSCFRQAQGKSALNWGYEIKNTYMPKRSILKSIKMARPIAARGLIAAILVFQSVSSASATSNCEPVSPALFEFLRQPPFVKSGGRVNTEGIKDTCQVEAVKASLFQIVRNSIQRSLGPPFDDWWLREGYISASAHALMNNDDSVAIPLRENSERYPVRSKRVGYSRILKWEFVSLAEIVVDVAYRDVPTQPVFVERVRYKTLDGKKWYLDEIVK